MANTFSRDLFKNSKIVFLPRPDDSHFFVPLKKALDEEKEQEVLSRSTNPASYRTQQSYFVNIFVPDLPYRYVITTVPRLHKKRSNQRWSYHIRIQKKWKKRQLTEERRIMKGQVKLLKVTSPVVRQLLDLRRNSKVGHRMLEAQEYLTASVELRYATKD